MAPSSQELGPPQNQGRFITASNINGLPFDASFKVEWRITNTNQAAYGGEHFVEAFLIGKNDSRLYRK